MIPTLILFQIIILTMLLRAHSLISFAGTKRFQTSTSWGIKFTVVRALTTQTSTKLRAGKTSTDWASASDDCTLVIVESPAKARTIREFVDNNKYIIDFSAGHIMETYKRLKDYSPKDQKIYRGNYISKVIGISTAAMGVDIEKGFKPLLRLKEDKKEMVQRLKKSCGQATRILLATDEDREGEAISYHLVETLKPKIPFKRAVFHEITEEAVLGAFESPRDLDYDLIQAQEARSVLDKLTGFTVSPLLWRKVAAKLSAGRVQSCALHAIVEKEKKRWNFKPSNYYSITALLVPVHEGQQHAQHGGGEEEDPSSLLSTMHSLNARRIATERDYDSLTGELKQPKQKQKRRTKGETPHSPAAEELMVLDEAAAKGVQEWLSREDTYYALTSIDTRQVSRSAPVPFITSTLQQECNQKFGYSPQGIMAIAQGLYERGFITYMRTDSPTLSTAAQRASANLVGRLFGKEFLDSAEGGKGAKAKASKKPKNAQEAHEAIRPVEENGAFKLPADTGLFGQEFNIYNAIFRRTLASVMKPSKSETRTYHIEASTAAETAGTSSPGGDGAAAVYTQAVFRSSHSVTIFPGYLAALYMDKNYQTAGAPPADVSVGAQLTLSDTRDPTCFKSAAAQKKSAATSATAASEEEEEAAVEQHEEEDRNDSIHGEEKAARASTAAVSEEGQGEGGLELLEYAGLRSVSHTTRAPARFSVSSFIKELEELGVGRPSTYARIYQVLQEREYVVVDGRSIIPTMRGMVVAQWLQTHIPQLVDAAFTAEMEQNLDLIARGELDKNAFLENFYLAGGPSTSVDDANANANAAHDAITSTTGSSNHAGIDTPRKGLLHMAEDIMNTNISNVRDTAAEAAADPRHLDIPFLADLGRLYVGRTGAFFETNPPATTNDEAAAAIASSSLAVEGNDNNHNDKQKEEGEEEEEDDWAHRWRVPNDMQLDMRLVTRENIENLTNTQLPMTGIVVGTYPDTYEKITLKYGRFGRYLQLGDAEQRLFFSLPWWVDQHSLGDVANAIDFIQAPKVIGHHPELDASIVVEVKNKAICVGLEGYPIRVPVKDGVFIADVSAEMAMALLPSTEEILSSRRILGVWRDGEEEEEEEEEEEAAAAAAVAVAAASTAATTSNSSTTTTASAISSSSSSSSNTIPVRKPSFLFAEGGEVAEGGQLSAAVTAAEEISTSSSSGCSSLTIEDATWTEPSRFVLS